MWESMLTEAPEAWFIANTESEPIVEFDLFGMMIKLVRLLESLDEYAF